MSTRPLPRSVPKRPLFPDRGERTAKLTLLREVYFDRTESAEAIIASDPDQINLQDPFAGLSALHVAIFRQNVAIVRSLASHPVTDVHITDRFGRRPIDMCLYTRNPAIFDAVAARTFQAALLDLEAGSDRIVPLRSD